MTNAKQYVLSAFTHVHHSCAWQKHTTISNGSGQTHGKQQPTNDTVAETHMHKQRKADLINLPVDYNAKVDAAVKRLSGVDSI